MPGACEPWPGKTTASIGKGYFVGFERFGSSGLPTPNPPNPPNSRTPELPPRPLLPVPFRPVTPKVETFPNPAPERDYLISHTCPEFTSVCPKTGQPDFATIELEFVPDKLCIELKSLKLYYHGFRNEGIYFEAVINRILDELGAACSPRWMRVTGRFNVRGGITSVIVAESGRRP